jgi:hypothetical protein
VVRVEEFRDRDADYLAWVAAHPAGYVVNIGRHERGAARLHRAACPTITSGPPFTGPYIKVCSAAPDELDSWALTRSETLPLRCGTCQPAASAASTPQPGPVAGSQARGYSPLKAGGKADEWEIVGPGDGGEERRVSLWTTRSIPYERLTPGQLDARAALRLRLRLLAAATGEILHASYAGFKPANADTENLLLYNIDATAGGCFQPAARNGLRFELATGPHPAPPSGRPLGCLYQYGLGGPGTDLTHWRPGRLLASFTTADLGRFPARKRLEQVWLAVHQAQARTAGQPSASTAPFAVLLTLHHPGAWSAGAGPELVKALIDGTVAAFQAHGNRTSAAEIAARLAAATGSPPSLIARTLLDDSRAVLGATDRLVHLRGTGVQWNPADHLCVAAQVVCRPAPGTTWMLSGEIQSLSPLTPAG